MWAYLYHKLKWIPLPSARIGWHYIQVTAYKSQCPFYSFRGVVNDQVASALHKTITRKNKKERCSSLNKTVRTHFTTSLLNNSICFRYACAEWCKKHVIVCGSAHILTTNLTCSIESTPPFSFLWGSNKARRCFIALIVWSRKSRKTPSKLYSTA